MQYAIVRDAHTVLEMSAYGQHSFTRAYWRGDRFWSEAAGASHRSRFAGDHTYHAVINPLRNCSVVHEKQIGSSAQCALGIVIRNHHWLILVVAARHHEWSIKLSQQQMMQWCRRQHEADHFRTRCHGSSDPEVAPGLQQHHWARERCQHAEFAP